MALCSQACGSGSGGKSSGSEAGSSCLHFGVRSYLHHFYEECSSSAWDRDAEDQGSVQSQGSAPRQTSAVWKVSLVLGVLVLTAGITTLSLSYSSAFKIESFGEGDLFFVDSQAVSFNRGVHSSGAAGIGLSCLGSGLAAVGLLLRLLQLPRVTERLFQQGEAEKCGGWGSAPRVAGGVVTRPPAVDKGTTPIPASKVPTEPPAP